MGAFFVYILKAAVCLSVFYLFYRLLLSRETFHRFNRIAVLSILVISLLIPFCEVKVAEQNEVHQTVLSLEQLLLLADMMEDAPVVEVQAEKTIWVHIVLLIYLAGILFFTCRNIYSLIRLSLLLKSGKREKLDDGVALIVHDDDDLAPFSWIKYVVISRKDLEENGREILIHELAHLRRRHSIDLLVADICIFFQWFNPAAWLLKQELQNIHEYEADETVIKEGVNAKDYQLLLIKKAVGTRLYSMANSFNHSKLKKRITMMLKEKSSPWARLKYLYVLPLAAIAVSAFARPEISNELKEISEVKVNDLTAIVTINEKENQSVRAEVDRTEWYVESEEEVKQRQRKNNTKSSSDEAPLNVKIRSVAGEDLEEEDSRLDKVQYEETTNSLVLELAVPKGKEEDEVTAVADEMTFTVAKPQAPIKIHGIKKGGMQPLYIIDGKESTGETLQAISPDHIKSISVLKDKVAVELYGEKAADGVVIITLLTEEEREKKMGKPEEGLPEVTKEQLSSDKPLILLDGNVVSDLDVINPDDVAEIAVYKADKVGNERGKALFEKYGDKANKGIISITSKKSSDTKGTVLYVEGSNTTAKTVKMQGQVIDTNGNPVAGAAIKVAGSTVGTVSDMEGKFSLEAREIDYITVVFIGMKKAVSKVSPNPTITLEKGD